MRELAANRQAMTSNGALYGRPESPMVLACATARLAEKLHERYGVEADVLDLLDALAEAGLVLEDDGGGNHARRAWDHFIRMKANHAF